MNENDGPPRDAPVFVVDDDRAMRESLEFLLASVELPVLSFASAREFLASYTPGSPGCLLVDVRMPGMSGLALQETLNERGIRIPVVFMTAHADVPMAVRAMRAGALDFIEKPFSDEVLLDRLHRALELEAAQRREARHRQRIEARLAQLSPRERTVLELVVEGLLNKQIAARLNLSIKTVELHRSRLMEKMEAGNVAELVRMATQVEVSGAER